MYVYRARVTRVVDGDTFDAEVDLGFKLKINHRFRLSGIDTPEIYRPRNKAELEHGREAKRYLEELVLGKEIFLRSFKLGIYGRYEAQIYLDEALHPIAEILREAGFEKRKEY
jgi:micrococcal nuclease